MIPWNSSSLEDGEDVRERDEILVRRWRYQFFYGDEDGTVDLKYVRILRRGIWKLKKPPVVPYDPGDKYHSVFLCRGWWHEQYFFIFIEWKV